MNLRQLILPLPMSEVGGDKCSHGRRTSIESKIREVLILTWIKRFTSCIESVIHFPQLPQLQNLKRENKARGILMLKTRSIFVDISLLPPTRKHHKPSINKSLGSSVSSTEKDIDTRLTKAWTAIDELSIIWKSDLTDKMKRSFFPAAVVSILLCVCTTWTLTKRLEKKLGGNYTRMLRAILNKSGRQHPTRHQLYGHLPPITKTIQPRRTRHAGHCWRSRDELISDVLQWTPTYGRARAGRPARTYIEQLFEDTGCSPEDLPEAMNDREKWRERLRDIRANGTTWWWWWWWWRYLRFMVKCRLCCRLSRITDC